MHANVAFEDIIKSISKLSETSEKSTTFWMHNFQCNIFLLYGDFMYISTVH